MVVFIICCSLAPAISFYIIVQKICILFYELFNWSANTLSLKILVRILSIYDFRKSYIYFINFIYIFGSEKIF